MATDCSSVKPSLWSRWTNLSVSKWWSLRRGAEAWKALRRPGCCRTDVGGFDRLWVCIVCARDCHGRWLPGCVEATMVLANGWPTGAVQLSRGSKNLGRVCMVFAMVLKGVGIVKWSVEGEDEDEEASRRRLRLRIELTSATGPNPLRPAVSPADGDWSGVCRAETPPVDPCARIKTALHAALRKISFPFFFLSSFKYEQRKFSHSRDKQFDTRGFRSLRCRTRPGLLKFSDRMEIRFPAGNLGCGASLASEV